MTDRDKVLAAVPDAEGRSGLSLFPSNCSMRFLYWVSGTVGGLPPTLGCAVTPDLAWADAEKHLRNS